jgi:hypothetical protein
MNDGSQSSDELYKHKPKHKVQEFNYTPKKKS